MAALPLARYFEIGKTASILQLLFAGSTGTHDCRLSGDYCLRWRCGPENVALEHFRSVSRSVHHHELNTNTR